MATEEVLAPDDKRNPVFLQHLQTMRILNIIGMVLVICCLSIAAAIVTLLIQGGGRENAVLSSLITGMVGIISLGVGILIPSPASHNATNRDSRRASDFVPAGTPNDPVSVEEVSTTDTTPKEAENASSDSAG